MKFTRRDFIGSTIIAGALSQTDSAQKSSNKIDRFALVNRHNPVLNKFEIMSPFSVSNGDGGRLERLFEAKCARISKKMDN